MSAERQRAVSGTVALAAALGMALVENPASGLVLLAGTALPLVLIWFAEPLASFVGHIGFRHVSRESPPGLVRAFGWAFLGVFVLAVVVRLVRAIGALTL